MGKGWQLLCLRPVQSEAIPLSIIVTSSRLEHPGSNPSVVGLPGNGVRARVGIPDS